MKGFSLQAYVDMFSKSLDLEYRQFGITCHNQAPAYVATKMSKIRKPTMDAPSPANWVKAAIAHIGYEPTQCPFPCAPPTHLMSTFWVSKASGNKASGKLETPRSLLSCYQKYKI